MPVLWQNFLRHRQIFEKTVKKAVFGHFLKNFDKKIAFFFGARSPSKLVYIGAKGALRKTLGSVGQKWISEKVSKGGPFGSAGGQIPEGGGGFFRLPAPPKSTPVLGVMKGDSYFRRKLYWAKIKVLKLGKNLIEKVYILAKTVCDYLRHSVATYKIDVILFKQQINGKIVTAKVAPTCCELAIRGQDSLRKLEPVIATKRRRTRCAPTGDLKPTNPHRSFMGNNRL